MKSVLLAVLFIGTGLVTPSAAQAAPVGCSDLEIVAHRGYHRGVGVRIDENTVPSFTEAAARGYTIETDVRADAEGKLWIMHDRNVYRTTGVQGYIDKMSSEEVSELRTKRTGSPIPSLAEAAAVVADNPSTRMYLEIKVSTTTDQVVQTIQDFGIVDQTVFTSYIDLLRRTYPDQLQLAFRSLQSTPDPESLDDDIDVVFFQESQMTPETVDDYQDAGLEVQNRLANTTDKWAQVLDTDLDSILTDKPDALREYCATA